MLLKSEEITVRRCHIWRIWLVWQYIPFKLWKLLASYKTCMGPRIILVEHHSFSVDKFWYQFVQLITVNFRINRCDRSIKAKKKIPLTSNQTGSITFLWWILALEMLWIGWICTTYQKLLLRINRTFLQGSLAIWGLKTVMAS